MRARDCCSVVQCKFSPGMGTYHGCPNMFPSSFLDLFFWNPKYLLRWCCGCVSGGLNSSRLVLGSLGNICFDTKVHHFPK